MRDPIGDASSDLVAIVTSSFLSDLVAIVTLFEREFLSRWFIIETRAEPFKRPFEQIDLEAEEEPGEANTDR